MRIIVTDVDGVVLADTNISRSTWEVMYDGLFNLTQIALPIIAPGKPHFYEIVDDANLTMLCPRKKFDNELVYTAPGDFLYFPKGDLVLTARRVPRPQDS